MKRIPPKWNEMDTRIASLLHLSNSWGCFRTRQVRILSQACPTELDHKLDLRSTCESETCHLPIGVGRERLLLNIPIRLEDS